MTVERAHFAHETRYSLLDSATVRCVLAFDTGGNGGGPAVWKVLIPGPAGTQDLYGTQEFVQPDLGQLTGWLAPIVGQDAATDLASAVDADPPHASGWRPSANG